MKKRSCLLIVLLIGWLSQKVFGGDWSESRKHEVMLFTGNSIPRFIPAPISHIFVFSYHELDNSWRELTVQIDELDGNAGYFGTNYNALVDTVDEFLFLAGEAGDRAPATSWIDDEDSRQYIRYEFEINNPDDPATKKYVYVYRSSTLAHDPNLPIYYIKYIAPTTGVADTIKAKAYLEGHNSLGIPDVWRIADSTGAYGPDILDRQKARVNGKYLSFLSYNMTEENLTVTQLNYKRGPIRILRDISYKSSFAGLDINVGTFQYRYYPYYIVALGADKKLDSDYGVKLIRQSFDLSANARGMLFNNPYNQNLVIDGIAEPSPPNKTIAPSPVMNWYMYRGNMGSVVVLNEFTPPSNASYELYYHESLTGSTADGTNDTGDKVSYGDVGILFKGEKLKGSISLPYLNYFLPGLQDSTLGPILANQAKNPLTKDVFLHNYIAPAQIAVSLPDTTGASQYPIAIPITIGNTNGLNILSTQLVVRFDPQILQAKGISQLNTLTQGWDSSAVKIANDTLFVTLQGTQALQDSGVLVYLNFNVIGSEGQQSPLQWIRARFNQWNPIALADHGSLRVLPIPEVSVSLPDTTGLVNSQILIPIYISDVTDLAITSCSMELQYNKNILKAIEGVTDRTIAAGWSITNFVDVGGALRIKMSGLPLSGSGRLLWIKFQIIGQANQSTNLTFISVVFNQGVPKSKTTNGKLLVISPQSIEVQVSIPDTTAPSLSQLILPIYIAKIGGYQLRDYAGEVRFDPNVLEYQGVDTTATVAFGWEMPTTNYSSGVLNFSAVGTQPIDREGVLLWLNFNVIGADSSTTLVDLSQMSFNSGYYLAEMRDGMVRVFGVVPVELSSFSATIVDRDVHLIWTTASERHNFGFFIERKSEMASEWQTIGFVPGKGTTAKPQQYVFIDRHPGSQNWCYRLRQQDLDGSITFSQIIMINLLPKQVALAQNYPNPFNSTTQIRYELPAGQHQVRLVIYDLTGKTIRKLVDEANQTGGAY
ncbi:MAG: cohesin domain-containing protein, partial [candidate division KSB1 bacterium]|nr:cohesin domain-containing protein [candidate division KSB1 bacterium]